MAVRSRWSRRNAVSAEPLNNRRAAGRSVPELCGVDAERLSNPYAVRADVEDAVFGVEAVDASDAGQRIAALGSELRLTGIAEESLLLCTDPGEAAEGNGSGKIPARR